MLVRNKTIVVTGGGNGIGRDLVLTLLSKGARVAAVDVSEEFLLETRKLAGKWLDRLSTHVIDVTNRDDVHLLPQQVIDHHGSVDGVINNAGIIQPFVRFSELEYGAMENVLNVNFYGTVYMVKAFLPHLLERRDAHIVNVSSMGGFLPVPGQSLYGASKAAVKLLTEALCAELINTNVKVSVVFPGGVATNIAVNSKVNVPNIENNNGSKSKFVSMPSSKAAEVIVQGMEKDKVIILVGKDSKMMNLLYRLNPEFAIRFIAKKMQALLQ